VNLAPGQRVRTRLHSAAGHTRLPTYVRGRPGVVHALRGHYDLPDDLDAVNRQALYSVRFLARDLWGADAGAHVVYLDLYESYLEVP
jgi:nitrile hydratase subunit beta